MRGWRFYGVGVLVAAAIGVFMVGLGTYLFAYQQEQGREKDRRVNERLTGVPVPPPTPEQAAADWRRDLCTGAVVSGNIWLVCAIAVFRHVIRERSAGRDQTLSPPT